MARQSPPEEYASKTPRRSSGVWRLRRSWEGIWELLDKFGNEMPTRHPRQFRDARENLCSHGSQ
ncbi:hypothetical protein PC116_g8517 [Phytophthora cactorum]|uniref:Uncharacterized protein n=1 Tax=Phytophthora cactorum TaxID=29920 RepID=A0A8T1BSY6_9STRA|nr:hypothetical protein Pcac1_g15119 [Phytophthora cactorum]KAG2864244.1 hypothetical protein PC113_g4751 [Phytophthora cactorum]KAG2876325.1 hypothetical protein PC114_g24252 [Phytophthora cactorum]KAG2905966.1 hypothetical protein PC115_g14434 [Phytophthora cactorum]KAG2922556.1 hypothetical protein PC117_g15937 [Phytophthora cactorum]